MEESPPDIGNPSTTIKGSLLAANDDPPRIRMTASLPGVPEEVMTTPDALPFNKPSTLVIAPLLKSLDVINSTEPVASFFFTEPYPT